MAEQTEGTIEIDAPPSEVMREIADFERYTEWSGEIKRVEVKERDARDRATQVAYVVEAPMVRAEYTLAYTYADHDGGCSWTCVEAKGSVRDLSGEYRLTPLDGGRTRVAYRTTIEPAIPLPGFVKRQAEKRVIDVALKGLKKRVESR